MNSSFRLILTDAAGQDLNDQVLVDVFSTVSSEHLQATARVNRDLVVTGMNAPPGSMYRVMVSPANHRIVQMFARAQGDQETAVSATLPVQPEKVVSINGPSFAALPQSAQEILDSAQCPSFLNGTNKFLTGADLYDALHERPLLNACFLNIVSKSAATPLSGGTPCIAHYGSLLRVAQDRLFLQTTAALMEEAAHSASFHAVSPLLHEPLPGYHLVSSYKTFDRYGNLQLTFQRRGDSGDDYVVDVDIDDAQGIEHLFQVVRNSVEGPTNPFDIHDILLQQNPKVDPAYQFVFATAAASRAA